MWRRVKGRPFEPLGGVLRAGRQRDPDLNTLAQCRPSPRSCVPLAAPSAPSPLRGHSDKDTQRSLPSSPQIVTYSTRALLFIIITTTRTVFPPSFPHAAARGQEGAGRREDRDSATVPTTHSAGAFRLSRGR
ncbi:hypothetical protein E2C01_028318 [Portunus trituberculatus]|uniref:Uncharacterized protein n=1 Tax=Portunus trituberculatus TaxID=210409 RepID=A0A5B7EPP6_PORTR|nr:hypothetical protein [Portunus trituberculatus]